MRFKIAIAAFIASLITLAVTEFVDHPGITITKWLALLATTVAVIWTWPKNSLRTGYGRIAITFGAVITYLSVAGMALAAIAGTITGGTLAVGLILGFFGATSIYMGWTDR